MALTYDSINTQTLSSNTTSVTFSSIPQTYTDLILVINAGSTTVDNYSFVEFNSDTAQGNYSWTSMYGNGSTASGSRGASLYLNAYVGIGSSIDTLVFCNIQSYTDTSKFKGVLNRTSRATSNGTYFGTELLTGTWRNTNAITQIKVNSYSTYSFLAGSTFSLYGIKAA